MPNISFSKLYDNTIDNILSSRNIKQVKNSIWKSYFDSKSKCSKNLASGLRILLLNAPCNGFGDLIFALKLSKYLKEWYGITVTLATTYESGLLKLGADPRYVVGLVGGKQTQCRRFSSLKMNRSIPTQDLIFIAPVQIDFDHSINDVRKIIPYSNEFNTFSLSEYNDYIDKDFTFNTGVGKDRDGILLTKVPTKYKGKPKGLKNPYAVIYTASINNVDKCILSFVEMIAKKYYKKQKFTRFDVVVPGWFADEDMDSKLCKKIGKYYPNILIKTKQKTFIVKQDVSSNRTLTFRADILPVSNKNMLKLMSMSIDDILLTGDQSITDALSCCSKKNIFYQIAPWKSDFGKKLAQEMPNIYLKKISTSCGTLKAISYDSNYGKFVKKWDFRTRARGKMDAIVLSAIAIKKDVGISTIVNEIGNSKSIRIIKNKVSKLDSAKRCRWGVKKDGYCKKKSGPKKL
jgi:hypothetical protein